MLSPMRLQVETEALIAAGYRLRGIGGEVTGRGHALESRVAACADALGVESSEALRDAGGRLARSIVELGVGYDRLGYALTSLGWHYQAVDDAAVTPQGPR